MRVCSEPGCGELVEAGKCVAHRREYDKARGTREERGYGTEHRATRAALLPEAYGTPCSLCGRYMFPHHKLDLDHTADRKGYRGIVHAHCNRSDGAKRGNAMRAVGRIGQFAPKVTLVCGPPCSGKSTYVDQHAQPGDLIVDYDLIAQSLGSRVTHGHSYQYHHPTEAIIEQRCTEIVAGQHEVAWVIRSLPDKQERARLALRLGAEVVVCDAPDEVLIQRASERPHVTRTVEAIRSWRHISHRSPTA